MIFFLLNIQVNVYIYSDIPFVKGSILNSKDQYNSIIIDPMTNKIYEYKYTYTFILNRKISHIQKY